MRRKFGRARMEHQRPRKAQVCLVLAYTRRDVADTSDCSVGLLRWWPSTKQGCLTAMLDRLVPWAGTSRPPRERRRPTHVTGSRLIATWWPMSATVSLRLARAWLTIDNSRRMDATISLSFVTRSPAFGTEWRPFEMRLPGSVMRSPAGATGWQRVAMRSPTDGIGKPIGGTISTG